MAGNWWERCEPNTDLQEANAEIGFMREDWQKLGEALGFTDFVDPEVIIAKVTTLAGGKFANELREMSAPKQWQPIETAPKDNTRLLYLARFNEADELVELDFAGIWESGSESHEIPEVYYFWASASGIEEPTHWAYQDEPLPQSSRKPA